jgi:hypothetical protein
LLPRSTEFAIEIFTPAIAAALRPNLRTNAENRAHLGGVDG